MPNLLFIAVSLSGYPVIAAAIAAVDTGHVTPFLYAVFALGMIARILLIMRVEFDANDTVTRIFMIPLLLEMIFSIIVGGMFSFVLLLGMGMSGATVAGVMVILWTFATGTVFASYSAAAAG